MTPTMLMIFIPIVIGLSFLLFMAFHAPREAPKLEAPGISPPGDAAPRLGTQRLLVAGDRPPASAATIWATRSFSVTTWRQRR